MYSNYFQLPICNGNISSNMLAKAKFQTYVIRYLNHDKSSFVWFISQTLLMYCWLKGDSCHPLPQTLRLFLKLSTVRKNGRQEKLLVFIYVRPVHTEPYVIIWFAGFSFDTMCKNSSAWFVNHGFLLQTDSHITSKDPKQTTLLFSFLWEGSCCF